MEYISDKIIETIKLIVEKEPETIFCGSLGLVLKNNLKRTVHDIDIITLKDYYSPNVFRRKNDFFSEYRWSNESSNSHKFLVGTNEVKCFKLNMPTGIIVDVFYNSNKPPLFSREKAFGLNLNVELGQSTIDAKKDYIKYNSNSQAVIKHLKDLILLDIPREELIKLINNSCLTEGWNKNSCLQKTKQKGIDNEYDISF